ncbi:MAG: hypothetical protein IPM98_01635 [Lewinellaceae bacterium]|nr:hypothetical protein [Lewinellaceae bacterium]
MRKQVLPHKPVPIHYVVWESMPGGMESYVSHYTNRFYGQRELFIFSLRPSKNGLAKQLDDHFEQGSDNNWACYSRFFRYARKHRRDLFHLMNGGPVAAAAAAGRRAQSGLPHPRHQILENPQRQILPDDRLAHSLSVFGALCGQFAVQCQHL